MSARLFVVLAVCATLCCMLVAAIWTGQVKDDRPLPPPRGDERDSIHRFRRMMSKRWRE